jgi:hypothetical protein
LSDICKLRAANGIADKHCDGVPCVFWRAVEQLGQPTGAGCAVQHFELLGDEGMAEWLLSVKQRVEQSEPTE